MQRGLARGLLRLPGGGLAAGSSSACQTEYFSCAQDRVLFNGASTGVLRAGAVLLVQHYRERRLVRRKMSKADAQTRKEYLD